MASLFFSPTPLSHLSPSPSTSTSSSHSTAPHVPTYQLNPANGTIRFQLLSYQKRVQKANRKNRSVVLAPPCYAVDDVSVVGQSSKPPSDTGAESIDSLKLKLLSTISGLNRGLAADEDDLRRADDAAKELEAAGGPVDLSADMDKLQGKWKLIYSSAFSSRTLGGSRPGPPTGRLLPITLGQVFQRIDVVNNDFDNIVDLELGAPWPLPPIEVTATLAHKFELIGMSKVKINFEKTTVKAKGNLSQLPQLDIPRIPDQFRPPSNTGSGEFEVTYMDSDTRITRGDREELRVFVIC